MILVSKDINMRIKARTLGLAAEDYFNDKVLEDTDLLYGGTRQLPVDFWDKHGKNVHSWQDHAHTFYRVQGPMVRDWHVNQFLYQKDSNGLEAIVRRIDGIDRAACRRRAEQRYSASRMAADYEALYARLVERDSGR